MTIVHLTVLTGLDRTFVKVKDIKERKDTRPYHLRKIFVMSYNIVGALKVHKYFHFYYKLEGFEGSKGKELRK